MTRILFLIFFLKLSFSWAYLCCPADQVPDGSGWGWTCSMGCFGGPCPHCNDMTGACEFGCGPPPPPPPAGSTCGYHTNEIQIKRVPTALSLSNDATVCNPGSGGGVETISLNKVPYVFTTPTTPVAIKAFPMTITHTYQKVDGPADPQGCTGPPIACLATQHRVCCLGAGVPGTWQCVANGAPDPC